MFFLNNTDRLTEESIRFCNAATIMIKLQETKFLISSTYKVKKEMSKEKYCFNVPEEGSLAPTILDYCFNKSTQDFLVNSGLTKGMKVLELGCSSGKMSCWIARQVGEQGQVIAIDNNPIEIEAARKYAHEQKLNNVNFQCLNVYDIETLKTTFDLIYCRFILHHLVKPRSVIQAIYTLLKTNGIAVIEEGIVNHAFTYPYNIAFGNERFEILDHHDNLEDKRRDGNFGIKLYHSLYHAGFKNLNLNIVAPSLITRDEKFMLRLGLIYSKQSAIENGLTEKEWENKMHQLDQLIEDDAAVVGFYQSVQVSGIKISL
jgi:ubiquinone/menaquinone biosynthesis C-methylase UbiE